MFKPSGSQRHRSLSLYAKNFFSHDQKTHFIKRVHESVRDQKERGYSIWMVTSVGYIKGSQEFRRRKRDSESTLFVIKECNRSTSVLWSGLTSLGPLTSRTDSKGHCYDVVHSFMFRTHLSIGNMISRDSYKPPYTHKIYVHYILRRRSRRKFMSPRVPVHTTEYTH